MKLTNQIRVAKPMAQEIELTHRWDKEWQTNFLSLDVTEIAPGDSKPITESVTICLNTVDEMDKLIGLLQRVRKKMK